MHDEHAQQTKQKSEVGDQNDEAQRLRKARAWAEKLDFGAFEYRGNEEKCRRLTYEYEIADCQKGRVGMISGRRCET